MKDVELKAIIDDLVKKFTSILNVNLLAGSVSTSINKAYQDGLDDFGEQFNVNVFGDSKRVKMLTDYAFDNVKGLNDAMADDLRKEITRALMNLESVNDVKKRVQKVMDVNADRAKMIARTEVLRSRNMGHIDGARESGLNLQKEWVATEDKRTSQVCNHLDGKRIPLNEKFKFNGQEFDAPPAHPNCRSTLVFVEVDA